MRLLHKNQKGFTLIELLIAVAITGLIVGGIALTIIQLFEGHAQSSGEMTALRQVQNAGYRISRDAQMANVIVPADTDDPDTTDGTDVLILYWTEFIDWYAIVGEETIEEIIITSIKHKVTYNLTDDSRLMRYHWATEVADHTDGYPAIDEFTNQESVTQIARYITDCTYNQGSNTLTVTADTGGFNRQTETRTYEIDPRPDTIY